MIENIMLFISFISLYLAIFWLNILYLEKDAIGKIMPIKNKMSLSFLVPAHNEEKTIEKTISSIARIQYPKNLFEIIIINDGSADRTEEVSRSIIKKYSDIQIKLLNQKNKGKAAALNNGLRRARYDLIAVVDADSTISSNSVKYMIPHFYDYAVGAVISGIKVEKPQKMLERIQSLEYLVSALLRRFFSALDTLFVTPGVLSIYRKDVLIKLGGFDEGNLTEDFEIAMRLQYNGYRIKSELNSIVYTTVPDTFKSLSAQRIRWGRGFVYNTLKYRDMFFNKKYDLMGMFQLPLNVFGILLFVTASCIILYGALKKIYDYILNAVTINSLPPLFDIPTFKDFILGMNIKIALPLLLITIIGLYFIKKAHDYTDEKFGISLTLIIYLILYPLLLASYWCIAFIKEYSKSKKEW